MIKDGHLTYARRENYWLFAEFENATLNGLVIAILSTILSYQATAIVFDILLGLKRKKIAPVNLFQVLLLVRRSSPVSVINSIIRRDWFSRFFFKDYLPEGSEINRDGRPICYSVDVRLVILLFAAPLINIIAVVLTFENPLDVTFGQAQFGGLCLGITSNNPGIKNSTVTEAERMGELCQVYPILAQQGDNIQVQFFSCYSFSFPTENPDGDILPSLVDLRILNRRSIAISVFVNRIQLEFEKSCWVATKSPHVGLQANVTVRDAESLVSGVVEKLKPFCNGTSGRTFPTDARTDETAALIGHGSVAASSFPCEYNSTVENLRGIILNASQKITLRSAERLIFVNRAPERNESRAPPLPSFYDGAADVFLERQNRTMSLTFMASLATMLVILRLLLAVLLNNDVHNGIERLIKERMGLKYCQSLLRHGNFRVMY